LQAIAQFAIIRKHPDFNIAWLKLDELPQPALFQRDFNNQVSLWVKSANRH
jgi:hypothetical protein